MGIKQSLYGIIAGLVGLTALPLQAQSKATLPTLVEVLSPTAYQFVLNKWNEAGTHLLDTDSDGTVDYVLNVFNISAEKRKETFRKICTYVSGRGQLISDYNLDLIKGRCNKQGLEKKIDSITPNGKVDSLINYSYNEKLQLVRIESIGTCISCTIPVKHLEEISYHDNGVPKQKTKYLLTEKNEKLILVVQEFDHESRETKILQYRKGRLINGIINTYTSAGEKHTQQYFSPFAEHCNITFQGETYMEDTDCDGKWDVCEASGGKVRPCNESDQLDPSVFLKMK